MVQQVATTRLDIAAPPGSGLDADVNIDSTGGQTFSLQLADAQSTDTAVAVRNDTLRANTIAETTPTQSPKDANVFVTDETLVNGTNEESTGAEVDQDLLAFLQRLDQKGDKPNTYDPTLSSIREKFAGTLTRLSDEVQAEKAAIQREASEEPKVELNGSYNLDLTILRPELSDNEQQNLETNQPTIETRTPVLNDDGKFDLILSEETLTEEDLVSVSSVILPNENENAEVTSESSEEILNIVEEQVSSSNEGVDIEQLERVVLHQPVIGAPLTQSTDNEPVSAQPLVSENNVAERAVENNIERSNEIVQNILQLNPEQQENAFNQISALAGLNAAEKASKEFVAGLKAGFEDIKTRYQAGQDVSNDLTQLVNQVADNLQENGQLNEQQYNQLTQAVGQFSQSFSTQGDGSFQSFLAKADNRVVGSSINTESLETNKIAQQNSAFEKAVNLAKPDAAVQLAEKVAFAVNARNLVADIRLDPADLGGIQARVSLQGDQASVNFVTQSQQARDLLEQQTPKLRELLDEQGIELGQSSVQQESQQTQDGQSRSSFAGNGLGNESIGLQGNDETLEEIGESSITNGHVGAIDYFV